ncbi:MAG: hypothetical protein AAFR35_00065 [Pseudomonadota bacterium]
MTRLLLSLALLVLAACENPTLGANLRLGGDGISVSPSVSGRVGDVGVTVTP